jgi:hypothetical protein
MFYRSTDGLPRAESVAGTQTLELENTKKSEPGDVTAHPSGE